MHNLNFNFRLEFRRVRMSTKGFSDFDLIWYVGRPRLDMHTNMISLQGQGHSASEVLKIAPF